MSHPHHHQHQRKRSKHMREEQVKLLDKAIVVFGFMNVLATLPQVLEIFVNQDASGVSSISWGYYTIFATMLLVYGFVHRERPIIVTYIGSAVLYLLVFIGSLMY